MRVVFAAAVMAAAVAVPQTGIGGGRPGMTIVMSNGNGMWNTGVWSGFGEGPVAHLRWAAEGIAVDKSECRLKRPCDVTQDQSRANEADAIIMETVNHPKFLGQAAQSTGFPFPARRGTSPKRPLLGMFYNEPHVWYPQYTTDEGMRSNFDLFMEPRASASVPITMMCPWGKPRSAFLSPPPAKNPNTLLGYFSGGGMDPYYNAWVTAFVEEMGADIHAYYLLKNIEFPAGVDTAPAKIDLMGTYKFVLVTEQVMLEDWVSMEFSQALLSGAVPVYVGAPNIEDFAPGPDSFVHVRRDWIAKHPRELAAFLRKAAGDETMMSKFFEWKKQPLPPMFEQKLDACVYYAECRLCNKVADLLQ